MPSTPPPGEPAPADGALPDTALAGAGARGFGVYVHVPFCRVRCGYCDFNTYTPRELGIPEGVPGPASTRAPRGSLDGSPASYAAAAAAEIRLARQVLGAADLPAHTVFFGGGTPTVLPPRDLGRVLAVIKEEFGLDPAAEVTTEANPDSVTLADLERLRAAGFTRLSLGMQSAVPRVLAVLDRTHDPDRVPAAVAWARAAGFEQVSLDLIYGTPGESAADWEQSLAAALGCAPDHLSAYALVVEPGTALARRVRAGELDEPDDDDLAEKYLLAEERLASAGLEWYEVSNWARGEDSRSRHNLLYWTGADWWGVGPGAHSHVNGVRWWNVRHPAAYAARLTDGLSPAQAREILDAETRRVERVLLEVRLSGGLPLEVLDSTGRTGVDGIVDRGLATCEDGRLVLSVRGRLLADAVVRELVG